MRADAQRSRRLLLDAACVLFVEAGIEVALEAVARRAGVGIATLYRHFPDRLALVEAVAIDVMARTEDEARAALADEPDGFAALRRYMHRAFDVCFRHDAAAGRRGTARLQGQAATRLKGH